MKKQNFDDWAEKLEKEREKRVKKKRPKMKVSGASVKRLQKIIIAKKKQSDI
jgi:predicted N-acyltransferase